TDVATRHTGACSARVRTQDVVRLGGSGRSGRAIGCGPHLLTARAAGAAGGGQGRPQPDEGERTSEDPGEGRGVRGAVHGSTVARTGPQMSKVTPGAGGSSREKFRVLGARRMRARQASEPDSRPPPVSFSPPKAPPISAPE